MLRGFCMPAQPCHGRALLMRPLVRLPARAVPHRAGPPAPRRCGSRRPRRSSAARGASRGGRSTPASHRARAEPARPSRVIGPRPTGSAARANPAAVAAVAAGSLGAAAGARHVRAEARPEAELKNARAGRAYADMPARAGRAGGGHLSRAARPEADGAYVSDGNRGERFPSETRHPRPRHRLGGRLAGIATAGPGRAGPRRNRGQTRVARVACRRPLPALHRG
jgi:hypothetical protein